ncbi:uncharacterized protein LOC133793966 [Humulus lupulus]|uniref:uncharacterized protein LOC133793966 n=1 Tax=Humulus lupulus TaxID=3486 RepID=UPI002B403160|nr:uncharacterized protein LOC133793966 [Humulus lupulus]
MPFRSLNVESNVVLSDFPELHKLMLSRGWIHTISNMLMPSQKLVREVYSNIDKHLLESSHPNKFKVYCRGKWFCCSPSAIAKALKILVVQNPVFGPDFSPNLNIVAAELAGCPDFKWPEAKGVLPTTTLSKLYKVIHKVTISNWLPNSHKSTLGSYMAKFMFAVGTGVSIDLSTLIFERIYNDALVSGTRQFLPFPCLLHQLAISTSPQFTAQKVPYIWLVVLVIGLLASVSVRL